MSPNNDDVAHVELKPEEVAQVKSTPVPESEVKAEVKTEPKVETKPEVKTEIKEVPEVKPVKFEDVFKSEKKKEEVKDMNPSEREEYETLKQNKKIQEHQEAYETILSAFDVEEREVLKKRLDKIIGVKDNPDEDIFAKLSSTFNAKQVAYMTTAIAFLEEIKEVEKIRASKLTKAVSEAEKKATASAEVKKTLVEIGDLKTVGEKGELSPKEQERQLINKAYKSGTRDRENIVDELLKRKLRK